MQNQIKTMLRWCFCMRRGSLSYVLIVLLTLLQCGGCKNCDANIMESFSHKIIDPDLGVLLEKGKTVMFCFFADKTCMVISPPHTRFDCGTWERLDDGRIKFHIEFLNGNEWVGIRKISDGVMIVDHGDTTSSHYHRILHIDYERY